LPPLLLLLLLLMMIGVCPYLSEHTALRFFF
jgi:hypothetical protein